LQKKIGSLEKTLGKTQLAKTKLEELCRNLNNSKKEADRNYAKLRQIEESNRESMEHFKTSINEIQKSVETRKEQAQRMQDVVSQYFLMFHICALKFDAFRNI
jgi:uncharacterized protein YaaN involved in tellurite resistance